MSGDRRVKVVRAVGIADQLPGLQRALDPVMIVVTSPRTTRHATVTDGTDLVQPTLGARRFPVFGVHVGRGEGVARLPDSGHGT
jgi:hypothetical protein